MTPRLLAMVVLLLAVFSALGFVLPWLMGGTPWAGVLSAALLGLLSPKAGRFIAQQHLKTERETALKRWAEFRAAFDAAPEAERLRYAPHIDALRMKIEIIKRHHDGQA